MPPLGARRFLTETAQQLKYLFRDRFDSDQAAPLASSRLAQPGPGTSTINDVESVMSISSAQLQMGAQATPVWGEERIAFAAAGLARRAGLTLLWNQATSVYTTGPSVGFFTSAAFTTGTAHSLRVGLSGTAKFAGSESGGHAPFDSLAPMTPGTLYPCAIILRGTGAFLMANISGVWTLLYVHNTNSTATIYPGASGNNDTWLIDDARIIDLPAPWNTDFGIATSRLVNPTTATAAMQTPDAILEWTFTYAGAALNINGRQSVLSPLNSWNVEVTAAGSINLWEVTGNSFTSRGSTAAALVTNGVHRIVWVMSGTKHTIYLDNGQQLTYTDVNNKYLTATGVNVRNSGSGAVSELVCWPRFPAFPNV